MDEEPQAPKTEPTLRFHYIKSNHFRVAHVDGGYGGITGSQLIMLSVYSERPAIPQITAHKLEKADGGVWRLGEEILEEKVSKKGVVREIEMAMIMDRNTAVSIRDWLTDKINSFSTDASDDPENT